VAVASATGSAPPANQEPPVNKTAEKILAPIVQQVKRQEFEKAPDDDINDKSLSHIQPQQNPQSTSEGTIKVKVEEIKRN
jgi:hypothetical protein